MKRQHFGPHSQNSSEPKSNRMNGDSPASRNGKSPLLDIMQAAAYLGSSERYLRRLIQERRIPFVKLGGTKIRFLLSDLDRWVESQRVEAKR